MLWTNQQNRRAKDKKEWPGKTDNAPGRFVFDVTVGNQGSYSVDCQITQTEILKLLTKHTKN
jgi:hypothetical protein